MKKIILTKTALVCGENALEYLKELEYKKAVIITGGQSMFRSGVIDRILKIMEKPDCEISVFSGISKNPTTSQVLEGVKFLKSEMPDCLLAVGGGSPMDAAKAMLIFYEYPELSFDNIWQTDISKLKLSTTFVAVPSTSGTASEVTMASVITIEDQQFKFAIKSEAIQPDIAILDPELPMSLPQGIAAETGMDALTHAIEAYINKNGNDFTYALAKEAIEGLFEWLPASCLDATRVSREKVHNLQCMAGMAFSNSGLGMVHGVSHAFGGKYNLAHGLANAIILPYAMCYNKKDPEVAGKFKKLSYILKGDIIEKVIELKNTLGIPKCIKDAGISEDSFTESFEMLINNSMKGPTAANPIKVLEEDMRRFVKCVYYGTEVDF